MLHNVYNQQDEFYQFFYIVTGLVGVIPVQLCSIITLRRLCICRCGLQGPIPEEIGQLVQLEEL